LGFWLSVVRELYNLNKKFDKFSQDSFEVDVDSLALGLDLLAKARA
jgi:hypothetical protein